MGYYLSIIPLALGFGFVIFWHELGHFLAAKWAGVKVEQFAVGFGTAIFSWRKGLGFTWGSSGREMKRRETADDQADLHEVGETEYRLNWLPLGGYVKMLGQDDLNPNAQVSDPRAYNMQPISKRMVIVSAGVVMNILLAAIGFFALFMYGFNAPPPIVGSVLPGSPAQLAGIEVGDRVLTLDGTPQLDYTKIILNTALLQENEDTPVEVQDPDGKKRSLTLRAARDPSDTRGMLSTGIAPAYELRGPDAEKNAEVEPFDASLDPPSSDQIRPGDTITKVNDQPIGDPHTDFYKFDRALQSSDGKPVQLTIKSHDGATRTESIQPTFLRPFDAEAAFDFLGMVPRTDVEQVTKDSLARNKLLPGDVIQSVKIPATGDVWESPTRKHLQAMLDQAGQANQAVEITVLRDEKTLRIDPITPSLKVARGRLGIGVALGWDEAHAVVASVEPSSAADAAKIPRGSTLTSINDQPVSNWHDVQKIIRALSADSDAKLTVQLADSTESKSFTLRPSSAEIDRVKTYRYTFLADFHERTDPRKTANPLVAAAWGIGETRDLIVQFYLTIKRMVQRSVPASNLMGPVGIVQAGTHFAYKGMDYLIWFLAMISANLAVVNFLPIPIVDGGLFLFLIIEKIKGAPLSPRVQSIAQVVGLALIVSVFIFVTYHDIIR